MRVHAIACLAVLAAALPIAAQADAILPTRDIAGARDNPLLKRYEGSFIVGYERKAFGEFRLPLAPLELTQATDHMNNRVHAPRRMLELEGAVTRLVYVAPAERSPLEVVRNYEEEARKAGGEILFTCKGRECGGDPARTTGGGGGDTSLMQYFLYEKDVKDPLLSTGYCALVERMTDQRFSAARFPTANGDAHVAVHAYQPMDSHSCRALAGRTIIVVHLVEPKPRESKMVVVTAADMSRSINSTGRIALYGVFFDHDKTEIKPESEPAIVEIAKLLRSEPSLAVLVVGHTDNVGGFDHNLDLSRRRAAAVIAALVKTHAVAPSRMRPAGVGMVAPAASNDSEEGRAKNRRVELVKLN